MTAIVEWPRRSETTLRSMPAVGARVCMTEVVQADVWQACLLRESLEVPRDVLGSQGPAVLAAEHEALVTAGVAPCGSFRVLGPLSWAGAATATIK